MKNILIFCSNIHQGGAVQVSVSIILQLAAFPNASYNFRIFCSQKIYKNLIEITPDIGERISLTIVDSGPFPSQNILRDIKDFSPDFTYVVFGPVFLPFIPGYTASGFAQPVLLFPDVAKSLVPRFKRPLLVIKHTLMKWVFRRFRCLVVEHEYLSPQVVKKIGFTGRTFVISNRINEVFLSKLVPSEREDIMRPFSLGYISRDYPHKNTEFLSSVRKLIKTRHDLDVDFYVTLTEDEWAHKSVEFRHQVINVGELTIQECPAFYQQMDAIIFPSLLECFSATPIEALFMKKPLFASDRPFVTGLIDGRAIVFDPLDPESAANRIASFVKGNLAIDLEDNHNFVKKAYCEGPSRAELLDRLIKSSLASERQSS